MDTKPVKKFWRKFKLWIVLGIAVVAFGLFSLIPGRMGGGGSGYGGQAATVNGRVISIVKYQRALDQIEKQRKSQMDQLSTADRARESSKMRQEAMSALINSEVTFQSAEESGVRVSASEIRDYIVDLPYFKQDGHFDLMAYNQILAANNQTKGDFEGLVRQELVLNHIRQLFGFAFKSTKQESELEKKTRETVMSAEVLEISPEALAAGDGLSSKEIEELNKTEAGKAKRTSYLEKANQLRIDLQAKIKTMDRGTLDQWARTNKLKWQDSGEMNLARPMLPKFAGETGLQEAVLRLKKAGDQTDYVIESNEKSFVAALKSIKMQNSPEMPVVDPMFDIMAMFRARTLFDGWQDEARESSRIDMNTQLLGSAQQ